MLTTCEKTKELIDAGSISELTQQHLHACAPCGQHQREIASLQALLLAAPRVAAPADFDARLKARLADPVALSDARLSNLLEAMPAVAAPSDFDFRLRARLARHKAHEKSANSLVGLPLAWLADAFGVTSVARFGQAGAAMAVLMLVGMMSLQLMKQERPASLTTATEIAATPAGAIKSGGSSNEQIAQVASAGVVVPAKRLTSSAKATVVRYSAPRKMVTPAAQPASLTVDRGEQMVAANLREQTVYDRATGREAIYSRANVAYGQQMAKTVSAARAEPSLAANVF